MPKSIQIDHQDTAFYIPKYHKTPGFSEDELAIYKNLERRYFHEGHVIYSSYLDDQPNLCQTFSTIKFDCLLYINEQICLVFVLQFYKSFRLIQNLDETIFVAFVINNVEICLRLEEFARVLRVPFQGVCMFSNEWSISSLPNCIDLNPNIYLPPIEDPKVICDTIFYERPPSKTRKIKKKPVVLDPYQMLSSEVKLDFKKWETILSENAVSFSGSKDHPNVCMSYMLYCLYIQKPFNLAYYIAKRIESVTRSDVMVLPYGMLLTRLYRHVHITHPYAISDIHHLVDHVMIPLTEGKAHRIMVDGKMPHP
ncbi:hypothetical protein Tco_1110787 [Tanacetum coccineum]|uniref:Uncharacterized protein n=1 Tax=Tanacetum coccineum TaxID=301880 RepID=A0ABQ5IMC4_9ASTR